MKWQFILALMLVCAVSIATTAETGFTLDGINYISYSNDFYKEITTGSKAQLYYEQLKEAVDLYNN